MHLLIGKGLLKVFTHSAQKSWNLLKDLRITVFMMYCLQVAELARERSETAIGYISEDGPLVLAPAAANSHVYAPGDMIIIIGNRIAKFVKAPRFAKVAAVA